MSSNHFQWAHVSFISDDHHGIVEASTLGNSRKSRTPTRDPVTAAKVVRIDPSSHGTVFQKPSSRSRPFHKHDVEVMAQQFDLEGLAIVFQSAAPCHQRPSSTDSTQSGLNSGSQPVGFLLRVGTGERSSSFLLINLVFSPPYAVHTAPEGHITGAS